MTKLLIPFLGLALTAAAQEMPTRVLPDASSHKLCAQQQTAAPPGQVWKQASLDLACQQVRIWTFPGKLANKKTLVPTLAIAGVTAALAGTDLSSNAYFRSTSALSPFSRALPGNRTKYAIVAAPLAFYGASLIRHDSYGQQTAILAGEALLNAELVTKSLKLVTGRVAPQSFAGAPAPGDWMATRNGSFPSGHSAGAFAVATVFAKRYSQHKWVPVLAYTSAAAIAFSTVTQSGHFPSEAFFGSALGFSISRFAVLK